MRQPAAQTNLRFSQFPYCNLNRVDIFSNHRNRELMELKMTKRAFQAIQLGPGDREAILGTFRVTKRRPADEAYAQAEALCEQARAMPHRPAAFVREVTSQPGAFVAVYLDTDHRRNDLLDSAGNPISAGWYLYAWPLRGEPVAGPFERKADAVIDGWLGE